MRAFKTITKTIIAYRRARPGSSCEEITDFVKKHFPRCHTNPDSVACTLGRAAKKTGDARLRPGRADRGVLLEEMTLEDLRLNVNMLSRRWRSVVRRRKVKDLALEWNKERCVRWLKDAGAANWGVGEYCRNLLRVVTGRTVFRGQPFPIGMSYESIIDMMKRRYPRSAAIATHPRWYATAMRAAGEMIPVYRERSNWRQDDRDEDMYTADSHGGCGG